MLPYWLLFSYFAIGSLISPTDRDESRKTTLPFLTLGAILTALMIGFRYKVGGDWNQYEMMFRYAGYGDLQRVLRLGDPGYQALNWSIQKIGGSFWWVNLASGAIFTWGLYRLARDQPAPWIAFTIAVPYLVIVVAMGYTRQAVAIGILMAGLASVGRGASVVRFAAFVAIAALFHKTAVVVLPIVIFAGKRNRLLNALAAIAIFILLYDVLLSDSFDGFIKNYVDAKYNSQGALIRVLMSFIPAMFAIFFSDRMGFTDQEEKTWRYFSYASIALFVTLFLSPSSTAVDRIALYILPLQIVVLSRVYILFKNQSIGKAIVVAYCFAVLYTWLNFAQHSYTWIPYQICIQEKCR